MYNKNIYNIYININLNKFKYKYIKNTMRLEKLKNN